MKAASFLKHAAVYGLASLLMQAGGLVLLPLYTRYLSPADYGVMDVVGKLGETVALVLVLSGVRQAVLTFYQQSETETERRQSVTAGLLTLALCCLLGGLALGHVSWLTAWLQTPDTPLNDHLVRLAILCILVEPWILVCMTLMQARTQSVHFVLVNLGMFVLRIGLCVFFVAGLGWGVSGVLIATALTTGLFGVSMVVCEARRGLSWPGWERLWQLWRFALPFLPGGLCYFIMHHGDRYFFLAFRGKLAFAEVGTYTVGYKLALLVGTCSLTPLHLVWCPQVYQAAKRPDAAQLFGVVFTRILGVFIALGLGLCLFREEVVRLLGGHQYAAAAEVIVPVVLAYVFQTAATLMDSGFYIRRRTDLKLVMTLAATAVMLLLYCLLIPSHGSLGAALATLGGFAFLALATWCLTQRLFPVRYEWGRLAGLLGLAVLLFLAGSILPATAWLPGVKLAVWLLYPLLAWQTGLISTAEKQYARDLTRQIWHRLRPAASSVGPRAIG